jgi:hypothetical protein
MSSALNSVIGHSPSSNHLLLGFRASDFCRLVLDNAIDPNSLLTRHTLLPIFTSVYNDTYAEELRQDMITGRRSVNATGLQRSGYIDYVSQRPRFCQKCILEDIRIYGHIYRRLPHQLATARHCIYHEVKLWEGCNCSAGFDYRADNFSTCLNCRNALLPIGEIIEKDDENALKVLNNVLSRVLTGRATELQQQFSIFSMRLILRQHRKNLFSLEQKLLGWLQVNSFSRLRYILCKGEIPGCLHSAFDLNRPARNASLALAARAFAWEQMPFSLKDRLISRAQQSQK